MRTLITGGAGFIGSHIADRLLSMGHEVVILDNLVPQVHGEQQARPEYLNSKFELVQADVRDRETLAQCIDKADYIIHNAALVGVGQSMYEIENYIDVNCRGSAILCEEILKNRDSLKKIIIASSMSIYGEGEYRDQNDSPVLAQIRSLEQLKSKQWEIVDKSNQALSPVPTNEDKPLYPDSVYAISKRDQEELFLTFGRSYDIPVVAFRYFNVIGSRQALSNPYTGVAAIFCSRLLNNNPPLIFEDGQQQRDFVHINDVVQANVLALENESITNDVFNIGSGQSISIADLAKKIQHALGSEIEAEIVGKYRAGDIRHCFADISKARKLLGFEPQMTIEDSVSEVTEWVRSQVSTDHVESSQEELLTRDLLK